MKTLDLTQEELSKVHDVLVIEFIDQELARESEADEDDNPHLYLAKFQNIPLANALEILQEMFEFSSFTIMDEDEIEDDMIDYDFTTVEELENKCDATEADIY